MVVVAQLVRAPDCGSGGRRFETDLPPEKTKPFRNERLFSFYRAIYYCSVALSTIILSDLLASSQAVWNTNRALFSNKSYSILSGVSLGL